MEFNSNAKEGKYYSECQGNYIGQVVTLSDGIASVRIAALQAVNESSITGKYSGYTSTGGNPGLVYSIYGIVAGQKYVKANGGTLTGSTYGSTVTWWYK